MITDDIALAEKLECKGLWRRAARVWLEVFDQAVVDSTREEIAIRRDRCLRHANNVSVNYSGVRVMTAAGGILND